MGDVFSKSKQHLAKLSSYNLIYVLVLTYFILAPAKEYSMQSSAESHAASLETSKVHGAFPVYNVAQLSTNVCDVQKGNSFYYSP